MRKNLTDTAGLQKRKPGQSSKFNPADSVNEDDTSYDFFKRLKKRRGGLRKNHTQFQNIEQSGYSSAWITDPIGGRFVGSRIRKYYRGHGMIDGIVEAYLPASRNEGIGLWHVRHDDGDSEDFTEDEVQLCKGMYDNDENGRLGIEYQVDDTNLPQAIGHSKAFRKVKDECGVTLQHAPDSGSGDNFAIEFDRFVQLVKLIALSSPGALVVAKLPHTTFLLRTVSSPRTAATWTSRVVCAVSVVPLTCAQDWSAAMCVVFDGTDHHIIPVSDVSFPLTLTHPQEELHALWVASSSGTKSPLKWSDTHLLRTMQGSSAAPSGGDVIYERAHWAYHCLLKTSVRSRPSCMQVRALLSKYRESDGDLWEMWIAAPLSSPAPPSSPCHATCPADSARSSISPSGVTSGCLHSLSTCDGCAGNVCHIFSFRDACFWYPFLRLSLVASGDISAGVTRIISVFRCADRMQGVTIDVSANSSVSFLSTSGPAANCDSWCGDAIKGHWGSVYDGTDDIYIPIPRQDSSSDPYRDSRSRCTAREGWLMPSPIPSRLTDHHMQSSHLLSTRYPLSDHMDGTCIRNAPSVSRRGGGVVHDALHSLPHAGSSKISVVHSQRRQGRRKEVEKVDLATGEVLEVFPSGMAAAAALNTTGNNISTWCRQEKVFADYFWRFRRPSINDLGSGNNGEISAVQDPGDVTVLSGSRGGVLTWPSDPLSSVVNDPSLSATRKPPPCARPKRIENRGRKGMPVEEVDASTGQIMAIYTSVKEAATVLGVPRYVIKSYCDNCKQTANGLLYRWRQRQGRAYSPGTAPSHTNPVEVTNGRSSSDRADNCGAVAIAVDRARAFAPGGFQRLGGQTYVDEVGPNTAVVLPKCMPSTVPNQQSKRRRKEVEKVDLATGEVLEVFPSGMAAAAALNTTGINISTWCRQEKVFADYFWRFRRPSSSGDHK